MKGRSILAFAVAFALAVSAFGQLPSSKQSNAPTSSQLRLKVLEPLPGAAITGNDFNVVVAGPPEVKAGTAVSSNERKDALTPVIQVWVDGKDLGNIAPNQNVLAVHTDGFGPHKIVVVAKNTAGELIDRQEISVTTNAPVVESSHATMMEQKAPAPAPAPVAAPVAPAPPAPAYSAPQATYTSESPALPKTASPYPLAALAGLALAGTGLVLRRRS